MGISLRVFLVNDDDSLQRLSLARFERLRRREPEERLPEYAGRRVRYALVILQVADRKPLEILRIQYSFLHFDSEGRIDTAEQERQGRLAMEMIHPVVTERRRPQVVESRHKFAQKRYQDRYKWTPSPEIEAAIVEAIFSKNRG